MKEVLGNIWYMYGKCPVCITTNGTIKKNGECVMGRGVALQAKQMFPDIPKILGNLIKRGGNRVYRINEHLYSFPVKHNWQEKADLELIKKSCQELLEIVELENIKQIVIPKAGCKNGKLSWLLEVKPIFLKYFDDRFLVIDLPGVKDE